MLVEKSTRSLKVLQLESQLEYYLSLQKASMSSVDRWKYLTYLSKSLVDCSAQVCSKTSKNKGSSYANCIVNNIDSIAKGKCQKEFDAFKQCYTKSVPCIFISSNIQLASRRK